MKKIIINSLIAIFTIFIVNELIKARSAGIAGVTSSPGENNCHNCHGDYTTNSGTGSVTITTTIPAAGYTLGQTYSVSVTVARTASTLFGFDCEALNSSNANAGTLAITDAVSTKLMTSSGKTNVVHTKNGGLVSGSKTFTFSWTAPSTNVGTVTFYVSGLCCNNNGNESGDYVYTKSAAFSMAVATATITTGTISGSPFCQGQTGISIPFTISGTFNSGNVFTAQLSNATGSFTAPTTLGTLTSTSAGTIVTTIGLPAVAGTGYRIRVISSNPAVTGTDNGTNLTISLNPTTANAGTDQAICATTATLAGNTPTVGSGTWTLASGTGTITTPSSPTSGLTALGTGQNKFVWTISNGTCTPSRDTVIINVSATPTTANAGTDQTVCATTATLAGNTPTVGSGTWTLASGTGTITTPSSPTSGLTALGTGQNKFVWTISNGTCTPSRDTVIINVSATPTTANAGTDQTVCATTATLAGNTPTVGTGTWTLAGGSGTITTPSSPTSGLTALGTGQNKFVWTIANGTCTPSRDTVIINVSATPTMANAGVDQTICATTATLAGNTPTVGTGTWILASGTGTITTPSSPTSGLTALGSGQNKFVWTIANGTCTPSRDTVIITRNANPTIANAGTDQTACTNTATLSGNTPATGTGTWTLASGSGTIINPSSPITGVTGLSVGQNKFVWTISNAPCASSSDTVIITQSGTITAANAGADQSICTSTTTLSGNTPTVGSGMWTLASGSGTVTTPSSPTSNVTGLGTGINKFVWTISNGSCSPSTDTVAIIVNAVPTVANAGSDQNICSASTTLAGNTPTVGTGTWTLATGSGVITTPLSPTSGVSGLGIGQNKFVWTISNGSCSPSHDTVMITLLATPTPANAGADQLVCAAATTLSGNSPVSGSGTWSVVSGSATVTVPSSPTSGVTGLSIGQNILVWSISNGSCTPSKDTVIITRNANPTVANAGTDQNACTSTATLTGNSPSVGTGTWTLVSGSGTIASPNNPTSNVTGLAVGQNKFAWTISNSPCASSSDTVIITQSGTITTANAGMDQSICTSTTTLSGNTPTVGSGIWTLASGSGTITTPSNPASTVTGLGIGTNKFVWTISNGSCTPSTDTVSIIVSSNPTSSNAGADQNICQTTTVLAGNTPTVGTGLWTVLSGSGTVSSPNTSTSSVSGLSIGQNKFVWTISNGSCFPSKDTVTITVLANPTVANAGNNQTVCTSSATLSGNTPTIGTGTWTVVSGGATLVTPNSPNSSVTNLGIGQNIFVWTISNSPCNVTKDTVTITRSNSTITANAGLDQNICGTSTTLSGNVPTAGTGIWTVISGSASISNANNATTTVTNLSSGQVKFVWTISNPPCGSATDTVVINTSSTPTPARAGNDQTICGNSTSLSGNTITVGTGTWTLYSGSGTIASNNNPATTVNNLNTGENIFIWTSVNGYCPASKDTVKITVYASPTTANAGSAQSVCENTATLNGNTPVAGIGNWSLVSGSGTITYPGIANTTVTDLGLGTNIFRWTISNAPCADSYSDVAITYNSCAATITTSTALTGSPFCSNTGYSVSVPFTTTGTFTGSFTAQLSDASGSFANPVTIGTSSTSPISAVIPASTPEGYGYLIRVVNSNSSTIGTDNTVGLLINTCKEIHTGAISAGPYCSNTTFSVSVPFTTIGNVTGPYIIELSDSTGSFDYNPLTIGFGYSSPIMAYFPSGLLSGSHYRIRIVSDYDGVDGIDNGGDILINTCTITALFNHKNLQLQFYPNPNDGNFSIVPDKSGEAQITVFDVTGNVIFEQKVNLHINQHYPLRLENMARGLYFIKVNIDDNSYMGSFIKE